MMKLVQRIVLEYYKIKFKVIELLSPVKAAEAAFELFCTPYSRQRNYAVPMVFEQAEKLSFIIQHLKIKGFRWKPEAPNGSKILICHGFDSSSYRFERYISPLLKNGFEVLAFDAPAHGVSSGKTINALLYSEVILEIISAFGPVDTIIAHSFGGIAAALAFEKSEKNRVKKLVLAAPATETTRSLNDFCRYLSISDKLKKGLERLIVQVGGQSASWFSVARIIQAITIPVLWIHDKKDRITPYEDMEFLTKLNLPHVRFIITDGLGHSLYRDDNIAEEIIAFICNLKC
jgi:pimeloyl-ACP methyl ester carboxylesterase